MPGANRVPLAGHGMARERLVAAIDRGSLPSSLLLHGPRGVGKQRLALWLAQELLCAARPHAAPSEPPAIGRACGVCQACRYAAELTHPDLRWVFPRPRAKDADAGAAEIWRDQADAIADRVQAGLLYPPPDGTDGIFVAMVRALVQAAAITPALGPRKVLVVGDAERMVPQEGSDAAANAFLKLLEEPPADTTIIMTSSEPGALLPTIRSRVVAVRVARLADKEVAAWVRDACVRAALDASGLAAGVADRVRRAQGAPGTLLVGARVAASAAARSLLDASRSPHSAARHRAALQQGTSGARGLFSDTLDALTEQLGERARTAVTSDRPDERAARAAAEVIAAVEDARTRAASNVNPQLIAANLIRALHAAAGQGL